MRSLLFSACVVLAVLGCGGDMDENMPCSFCGDDYGYKCGSDYYDAMNSNLRCQNDVVETRCGTGSSWYNSATHFCYNNSKVVNKCGSRIEAFDPDLYECREESKIYLKTPVVYENESYEAILIGEQTWIAENLNYNASGSRCYGDNTGGDSQGNCAKYGRLYDWATAMALDASCNSSSCASQVQAKHRGVCPAGWHIPSDAEWDVLMTVVGGSSTAGRHLKATNGWNNDGNGLDTYGFAALPGGYGYSYGSFHGVGIGGNWWSATEYSGDGAYLRTMGYYSGENAYWNGHDKSNLYSVRCLQD